MNKLELIGEIVHIGEVEMLPTGNTEKRIFVIEIDPGKYSQQVAFELFKDKVGLINAYEVGQTVTVSFNIRGREYQGKWYTNLQAWKISASSEVKAIAKDSTNPDLPPGTKVDEEMGL